MGAKRTGIDINNISQSVPQYLMRVVVVMRVAAKVNVHAGLDYLPTRTTSLTTKTLQHVNTSVTFPSQREQNCITQHVCLKHAPAAATWAAPGLVSSGLGKDDSFSSIFSSNALPLSCWLCRASSVAKSLRK